MKYQNYQQEQLTSFEQNKPRINNTSGDIINEKEIDLVVKQHSKKVFEGYQSSNGALYIDDDQDVPSAEEEESDDAEERLDCVHDIHSQRRGNAGRHSILT